MKQDKYIHGVHEDEQDRLRLLNKLTNSSFLDFVKVNNGEKILELGSGLGIVANEIAKNNELSEVIGLEYSLDQIEKCSGERSNLNFIQGDAHITPFENEYFDVIYGRYILEHLKSPQKALKEVYRILKRGGRVYFQENTISLLRLYPECPKFCLVWEKFVELQSILGGDAEVGKKLFYLLNNAGFDKVVPTFAEEIHYESKGTLVFWIDNLIGNIEGAGHKLVDLKLCDTQLLKDSLEELTHFKNRVDSSAYFYWNRIIATKTQ